MLRPLAAARALMLPHPRSRPGLLIVAAVLGATLPVSCAPDYRPPILGGTLGLPQSARGVFSGTTGAPFTQVLIQDRTFIAGQVVTTATYRVGDLARTPLMIDFNGDSRIDPVVAYQQGRLGVVQILLSYRDPNAVQFASLTLDGGENEWSDLRDVAVGDIDGDGSPDIVLATADGVIYLHHPSNPRRTHVLSEWGAPSGALELILGTRGSLTTEELDSLIATTFGVKVDKNNYIITVSEGYSNVEIGDFDNDGHNDVAASRQLQVTLEPKPDYPVEKLTIVAGSIQVLINPGRATTGEFWTVLTVGRHERHPVLDREGARDLHVADMDGDGDLDVVTAAAEDQNVQVAWFENPGGPGTIDPFVPWRQHRVGSLRGATSVDVADLTGDGRPDVVAVSPVQMQMVLFVGPDEGATRGYDWFTVPIVTFQSYQPRAVKALDVNNDGVLELVVGGSAGAVRYFSAPPMRADPWIGYSIATFDPPGDVGDIGYGDLDGDGDIDLVVVVGGSEAPANRVVWIRNESTP